MLVQVRHVLVADFAELVAVLDGQVDLGQFDGREDSDRRSLLPSPPFFAVAIARLGLVGHLVVGHCDLGQGGLDLQNFNKNPNY